MNRTIYVRSMSRLLLLPWLVATGCIITTGEDDDETGDFDTGNDDDAPTTSGFTSATLTSSTDPTSADDTVGETTAAPTGECTSNLILDGGFEGGTPSADWTEASTNFNTPICDVGCTEDAGADPYMGDWYCWFGGIDTDPEIASVSQAVTLDGQSAYLSFWFQINAAAGTGDDYFFVDVDETTIFMVTDAEIDEFTGYTKVSLDISDFVDGQPHTITFTGDFLGDGALSNFFLDEVELVTCSEGADTTGSGTTDASTTDATTSTGSTESSSGVVDDSSSGDSDSTSAGGSSDSGSSGTDGG
jgi:hypothetical protein